jgi:general secretion pathway protein G
VGDGTMTRESWDIQEKKEVNGKMYVLEYASRRRTTATMISLWTAVAICLLASGADFLFGVRLRILEFTGAEVDLAMKAVSFVSGVYASVLAVWQLRRGNAQRLTLWVLILMLTIPLLTIFANAPGVGLRRIGKETRCRSHLAFIAVAVETFRRDTGRYPTNEEGLKALIEAPASSDGWKGPYLGLNVIDPWGNVYRYRFHGTENDGGFELWSLGADGRTSGDDIYYDAKKRSK